MSLRKSGRAVNKYCNFSTSDIFEIIFFTFEIFMPIKAQLTEQQRNCIVNSHERGLKQSEIAGKFLYFLAYVLSLYLDRFNISKSTVSRIIKRFTEESTIEVRKRSGRPRKVTEATKRAILRTSINNRHMSSSEIAQEFSQFSKDRTISSSYVRKICLEKGFRSFVARKKPFLNRKMIKARMNFCKNNIENSVDYWRNVVFSDEAYIEINLNSIMNTVRRFPTEDPNSSHLVRSSVKHPLKIMIWGCFGYNGVGRIHICETNMNQNLYLNTLKKS